MHAQEGYCSCPCLSVCQVAGNSLLKHLFVLKMLSHTQWATKVKTFVGICLKPLRSRVMPRNRSEKANMLIVSFLCLTHSEVSEGYPMIVNNIQPCPKRFLLMLLARVGARTDSTTHLQLQREAWPISTHMHWHSVEGAVFMPRVLHFSAFSVSTMCHCITCTNYIGHFLCPCFF